jgi:hypothetical protein
MLIQTELHSGIGRSYGFSSYTHDSLLLYYLISHFGCILQICSNVATCDWTRTFFTHDKSIIRGVQSYLEPH